MNRPRLLLLILVATALETFLVSDVIADEGDGKQAQPIKNRFADLAARISIAPAGRPRDALEFRSQPALSWSNPTRRNTAGALFLWTAAGRPQVALCIYPNGDHLIDLEFQSLSDDALTADSDEQLIWQPAQPGVRWREIEHAQPPARTAPARLRQMRLIARKFSSKLAPPNKSSVELRLLDTPVYRYELNPQRSKQDRSDANLTDGAMFTFVQGTDPEVLLLIESYTDGDDHKWRYALARMSIVPTQVHHDGNLIWQTHWPTQRTNTPYYVHQAF